MSRFNRTVPSVSLAVPLFFLAECGGGGAKPTPAPSTAHGHVIEIDVDDHGLAGLWMANAPNLKGLIARGTLAYSRVVVPTHSNQNNMALLTGQYPEGNNVPSNSWLSRAAGFTAPLQLPGVEVGDYADYGKNPLLVRGDSVYAATRRAGARSAYFGQLPPFEAGADEVHLTIVGASFGATMITAGLASGLLTDLLHYPKKVVDGYHLDGPAAAGETYLRFTIRDAAAFIRSTTATSPMPAFTFIWDFIAIDDDPTSAYGAGGDAIIKVIEDYDVALGDLLAALREKSLLDDTNILFTLDHGKVDTTHQVALGTRGQSAGAGGGSVMAADGQLGALVAAQGGALGITPADYAILNEDGDALIYARVDGAGTAAGATRQAQVTQALLSLIQSGQIMGLDVTRTMTADGAMGTRTFHDFRGSGPNQADIVVFPIDDWTLNQVDAGNSQPGPFREHTQFPFGRHGGFSADELYVPLIMAGPAFKVGALLPHPIEHPDVPATALAALGGPRLTTAARGPIRAALAGDVTEAWPQPADLSGARPTVLDASGFGARQALAGAPAAGAVIIDAGGIYEDELFDDDALAEAARPVRDLAAAGTRFSDVWARSRDWPVTEYQMLTGGYPTAPFVAAAEDDPTQTIAPAAGLLKMPIAPGFVAGRAAYDAWRQTSPFAGESLFDAAHALGLTTALIGAPDFHAIHLAGGIDMTVAADGARVAAALRDLITQQPHLLAVVTLGGARLGDRHAAAAQAELAQLTAAIADIAGAARDAGALVAITSRGATTIDDPDSDRYGAGTSRHVPLILLGPNVRAGAISGQPGSPADLPATILFGLGAPVASDVATGTWARGAVAGGVPQPTPRTATEGHALTRGFVTVPAP